MGLFRRIDRDRGEQPVDVYIYASHAEGFRDPEVTWHARYVRSVDATEAGLHPRGMEIRPPAALSDTSFAVFWEVKDLRRLEVPIAIKSFTGLESDKPYKSLPPEGPMLIKHPG
jgi:hypothetical protein